MHKIESVLSGERNGIYASLARSLLWMLSKPYGLVTTLRNWGYDRGWLASHSVDVPVIAVGNLTVGGTGKSPAVMMLAKWFRERGIRVSIVSRGYRAGADGTNDEAKEMESRLPDVPHLQNPDRVAAAKIACEELETELILLDDGFQHRRMKRDLNIVLIDAIAPFGYGHLLPRGLLREPIRSLKRVDIVMVTRADQVDSQRLAEIRTKVQRYAPKAAWIETEHRPFQLRNSSQSTRSIESLLNKKIVAFCGLGNPRGFLESLRRLQLNVVETLLFPDHHPYGSEDIRKLAKATEIEGGCDALVCSGKDLAKIGVDQIAGKPVWSLDIELYVRSGLEPLEERLQELLDKREPHS